MERSRSNGWLIPIKDKEKLLDRVNRIKGQLKAILFAATLLCVRKLMQLDLDRPSPAKVAAVENAISQAAFILECIYRKWPE